MDQWEGKLRYELPNALRMNHLKLQFILIWSFVTWRVILSVCTSLITCSLSICLAYNAVVCGTPLTEESSISYPGLGLMFLGYLSVLTARFFSLEFLFVTSNKYFFGFCLAHWAFMFSWSTLDDRIHWEAENVQDVDLQGLPFLSKSYIGANACRTFSFIVL